MPKNLLTIAIIFLSFSASSQKPVIDTAAFADAAHHWYDIYDKTNVINPLPSKPTYLATNITAIADNILRYQKTNGGWPKNYDVQAILNEAQKDSLLSAKNDTNTTFDNGTTYPQIAALAQAYTITLVEKYKIAALKGLAFIQRAQYANGGWPQYYPLETNYSRCITFNDGAFGGIMWLLKDIVDNNPNYRFISKAYRKTLQQVFAKGLNCILKLQINDAGKLTTWCQQYNEVSLQPAWARKFEPPSICNGESVDIVLLLMSIKNPSVAVVGAVQNAIEWFKASAIANTRVKIIPAPILKTPYKISTIDRVVVIDSTAPPIWARYYELQTHKPLFCNRDSKVVYSLAEVERERRDGYGWYTYAPQEALNTYPIWAQEHHIAFAH